MRQTIVIDVHRTVSSTAENCAALRSKQNFLQSGTGVQSSRRRKAEAGGTQQAVSACSQSSTMRRSASRGAVQYFGLDPFGDNQMLQRCSRRTAQIFGDDDMDGLDPLEVRHRRAARSAAKIAMRERRAALESGAGVNGDAGDRLSPNDQLHEMPRSTAEDRARWAADRARPTSPIGVGRADGTKRALARVHEILFMCTNCNGLVDGHTLVYCRSARTR